MSLWFDFNYFNYLNKEPEGSCVMIGLDEVKT